jgi:hypothetical protein
VAEATDEAQGHVEPLSRLFWREHWPLTHLG